MSFSCFSVFCDIYTILNLYHSFDCLQLIIPTNIISFINNVYDEISLLISGRFTFNHVHQGEIITRLPSKTSCQTALPQECTKLSIPIPPQKLEIIMFLNVCKGKRCRILFYCCFNLHFHMYKSLGFPFLLLA